jgi:hypothetical protein
MVLTTKEASYIIVLGIVVSVLPISSTLHQNGYHVHFKQKTLNKGEQEPINHCGSPRNKCTKSIYFPIAFPMPFRVPIPTMFP